MSKQHKKENEIGITIAVTHKSGAVSLESRNFKVALNTSFHWF